MEKIIATAAFAVVGTILLIGIFKRPYLYVRNIIISLFCSAVLVGGLSVCNGVTVQDIMASQAFPKVIMVATAVAAFTAVFGLFGIRFHGMLAMAFSGLGLYCALTMFCIGKAALISIGATVVLAILGCIFSEGWFALERSAVGAFLVAKAAANIFGTGQEVNIVIFTALAAIGSVAGIAVEIGKRKNAKKHAGDVA